MSVNKSEYEDELNALVGSNVVVAVSVVGIMRNNFLTQMCVNGTLERNEAASDMDVKAYRVLLSQNTYCYFGVEDIYLINPIVTTDPVIHIRIDTLENS